MSVKGDAIGRRRRRILIERPDEIPDGAGGRLRIWNAGPRVWGAVEPRGAEAVFAAEQAGQRVTHLITLHPDGNFTLECRLRVGTRIFQPRSFHEVDDTGRYVAILAEEVSP